MLFMVMGPWMTPEMYALQLAMVVALAAGLLWWLRRRPAAPCSALQPVLADGVHEQGRERMPASAAAALGGASPQPGSSG
jgi:uncharacterized iron-regulated membrane protein